MESTRSNAAIGSQLGHVAAMLHRQTDQILQERLGLGLSQFNIMSALLDRSQVKQRTLAASLGQTEASISRQIALLKEKGLLVSHIDPGERRRHLAVLTPKGAKITLAAQEVLEDFYRQLLSSLSDRDQTQFYSLLASLHEQTCSGGKHLACNQLDDAKIPGTVPKIMK